MPEQSPQPTPPAPGPIVHLTPTATRLIVHMAPHEQERHDRAAQTLHAPEASRLERAQSLLAMLDAAAPSKARAAEGFLHTLEPSQPTVIFLRNEHERSLAATAARNAGFPHTGDGRLWLSQGGVYLVQANDPPPRDTDLSGALYALFLGRPPSRTAYLKLQAMALTEGQDHPHLVHFIAHQSVDKRLADILLNYQPPQ